jgi:hypothetical protein
VYLDGAVPISIRSAGCDPATGGSECIHGNDMRLLAVSVSMVLDNVLRGTVLNCIFSRIPMLAALIHAIFVKHEERYHHFVWDEIHGSDQAEVQVTTETTPLLGGNRQNMSQQ